MILTTLAQVVDRSAAQHAERPALRAAGQSLNYTELQAAVRATSRALLKRLALGRGERVAVFAEKRIDTVVSLLAISAAGGVFVPVNPGLKPGQLAYILDNAGARVLVTTPQRWRQVAPALQACEQLQHVVLLGEEALAAPGDQADPAPDRRPPTLWAWAGGRLCQAGAPADEPAAEEADEPAPHRVIDGDLAALLYTSGSTGQPKGVMVSHRNLVEGARSVEAYLDLRPDDVVLAVLPLSFDYGLNQLNTSFLAGACAVLHNHLLPRDVIEALLQERVTTLAGVPPLWAQLTALPWPAEVAQRLRIVTNSGGHLPLPTLTRLRALLPHTQVVLMYGLTEAFRSTWLPPSELDRRPGSIGRAIPNAEILVLREDGSECAPEEIGELVHRGVHVSLGYWNDPARTAERFKPLPLAPGHTLPELAVWSGDLVRRDAEGYLYFVGRRDDTIKSSGYRVSPTEVEDVVCRLPGVAEVAAFGVPHSQWGQAIVVVLQQRQGETVSAAAVQQVCRRELASHMQPAHVEITDEVLPRNPNGKVDRPALVARFKGLFAETPA